MAIIPMKCSSCGGALEIGPDMESFSCGYCGTALLVERKGGTVALKMVAEGLKAVQAGTDKTAAELAIKRLTTELAELETNYRQKYAEYQVDLRVRQAAIDTSTKHAWQTDLTVFLLLGSLVFWILFVLVMPLGMKDSPSLNPNVFSIGIPAAIALCVCYLVVAKMRSDRVKWVGKLREEYADHEKTLRGPLDALARAMETTKARLQKQREIVNTE